MELNVDGAYIYFVLPVFGGIPVTQTMVSSCVVTLGLCGAFVFLGRGLQVLPDGKQTLTERAVGMLEDMVRQTMGEDNVHWTPFIGAVFLSSICGSFIGLTGFLRATTADLSTTLVWAVMVSGIIWNRSIKSRGFFGWLRGFTKPIPVMTPMNFISEIAQPVSMAFRHFGNVAGGGVITALLYTSLSLASTALIRWLSSFWPIPVILLLFGVWLFRKKRWQVRALGIYTMALGALGLLEKLGYFSGVPILALGIPGILSCYFDLFSGFVQAYVFTLLTMVYIAGADTEN